MAERKRNKEIHFYVTEEERKLIRRKMIESKTKNMGAYLRKMAIDGYIVNTDTTPLKKQYEEMSQWMILWKIHVLNYSRAKLTMGFHNLKFFIGKSAWFIQYFFRNTNLTNIMKERSSCNQSNICLCQRISICYFYQLSQHHLRCCFNIFLDISLV